MDLRTALLEELDHRYDLPTNHPTRTATTLHDLIHTAREQHLWIEDAEPTDDTYFHLDEDQALHITPTTETNLDT